MKVALFTSQDVGPNLVEFFSRRADLDLLVITQETARDKLYGYASTEEACRRMAVRYLKPSLLDVAFIETIRAFEPDIIISVYYPKIFPRALLEIPKLGAVNVHPGDLPNYRGRFAIPWAILNGEEDVTVSMHYIDENIDSGNVIVQSKFSIMPGETSFQLYLRAMHRAGDLVMSEFDNLVNGKLESLPQVGYGTYYTQLEPRCHINWQSCGQLIERLVRVHAKPYLPAYGYVNNHCIYINRVSFSQPAGFSANSIGTIVDVEVTGGFSVSCANGLVRIEEYDIYPLIGKRDLGQYIRVGLKFD